MVVKMFKHVKEMLKKDMETEQEIKKQILFRKNFKIF